MLCNAPTEKEQHNTSQAYGYGKRQWRRHGFPPPPSNLTGQRSARGLRPHPMEGQAIIARRVSSRDVQAARGAGVSHAVLPAADRGAPLQSSLATRFWVISTRGCTLL
jgi:hypothetical protein